LTDWHFSEMPVYTEPQAWHRAVGFEDAGAIVDLAPLQNVPEIVFIKRVGANL
jgi:hypothetical protein